MRKPAFYICENKDADQLCGNREADQLWGAVLLFIPYLGISKIHFWISIIHFWISKNELWISLIILGYP